MGLTAGHSVPIPRQPQPAELPAPIGLELMPVTGAQMPEGRGAGAAAQHEAAGAELAVVLTPRPAAASAELPFVFDHFYRGGPNRHRAAGGAGLGLAITKRILELHDTDIQAESDATSGTCFTFSPPLHGAPRAP